MTMNPSGVFGSQVNPYFQPPPPGSGGGTLGPAAPGGTPLGGSAPAPGSMGAAGQGLYAPPGGAGQTPAGYPPGYDANGNYLGPAEAMPPPGGGAPAPGSMGAAGQSFYAPPGGGAPATGGGQPSPPPSGGGHPMTATDDAGGTPPPGGGMNPGGIFGLPGSQVTPGGSAASTAAGGAYDPNAPITGWKPPPQGTVVAATDSRPGTVWPLDPSNPIGPTAEGGGPWGSGTWGLPATPTPTMGVITNDTRGPYVNPTYSGTPGGAFEGNFTDYKGNVYDPHEIANGRDPNAAGAPAPPAASSNPGIPSMGGAGGPGGAGGLNSSPSIEGVNLGSAGQGEQFWDQNQGKFNQPTASQGLLGSAAGQFGLGGNGTANNQQGFFDQFNQKLPSVMQTPGLDPYYDRAIQKGTNDIDKSMAARGIYGSSAANDQIGNMVGGLRADQANREAQYNLQKLGEERSWQGLGGNLAQGADTQSLGQSANQRGWLGAFGGLAGQADTTGLGLLNSGMNNALGAQGAGVNRFNTAMGAQVGLDTAASNAMGDAYKQMFGNDEGLFNNWVQLGLGPAAQNLNMNQYLAGQNNSDLSGLLSGIGKIMGSGAGGPAPT